MNRINTCTNPFVMLMLLALPLCALAQSPLAVPQDAAQQPTPAKTAQPASSSDKTEKGIEIETGFTTERLSNGYAPWSEAFLTVSKRFAPHQTLALTWQETNRFSQRDHAAQIGFHQPLNGRWAALVELKVSPTHRILPKWSSQVQLERRFEQGWGLQTAWRHSVYNDVRTNLLISSVERYFSRWRTAYTLYAGARPGAGLSASHLLQGNYYYNERSSIGLGVALGRELENIAARGIIVTQIRGASLNGRHWFNSHWGLNYQLTLHQQGDLYTRKGAGFGLRYQF